MSEENTMYFLMSNPTKTFIQKVYRLHPSKSNPEYYGEQGGWHSSETWLNKLPEFLSSEFITEISEEEVKEYIKN